MNHLLFIEPAFAVRFATTLLHFLWQGCLVAVLAMAGEMLLLRAAAHWRYVLHVSALLLMAACMPVTLFCVATGEPPATKPKPHAEARRRGETEKARNPEGKGKGDKAPVAADFANRDVAVAEQRAVRPGETEQPDSLEPAVADTSPVVLAPSEPVFAAADGLSLARSLRQWAPHISAAYFACLAMLLARLIYGAWGGYRLRQKSDAITDEPLLAALKRQTRRLSLRSVPAIAWCEEVSVPVVIGVVRPMILLPAAAATGLSPDQLESLITHELAHVRRWDLVVNLLQRLIESALFFHPAVWLISRRIDREREEACDELVLATGCGRVVYADSLVRMAELSSALRGLRPTAQATSLSAAGARPSEYKRRILKILGPGGSSNVRPGRMTVLLVVAAMVLAAAAGATWMQFQAANAQSPEPAAAAVPEDGASSDPAVPLVAAAAEELPDLRLEGKQVTVEALAELSGRELGTVTLANVRFNGAIVEALRKAKSIHTLRLFGEELSGQIPRLKIVPGLRELELGGPLTSGGIQAVSELTQLERLVLPQELTINVTGARMLARLVNLKSLGMYNVNLDDASFVELRPLVNLEELNLTHTTVTDEGLKTITSMPHLKRLYLDRYPEKQFPQPQLTDACIRLLAKLPELDDLSLGGTITDEGLKQLARLPKLRRLSIVHTEITGAGLAVLENSNVEDLVISPMGLESIGEVGGSNLPVLNSLRKCRNLKRVMVIGQLRPIPFEVLEKAVPNVRSWSFNG